jgi:hypothetical protein
VKDAFVHAWVRTSIPEESAYRRDTPLHKSYSSEKLHSYGNNAMVELRRMQVEVYYCLMAAYHSIGPCILAARITNVPSNVAAWPQLTVVMERGWSLSYVVKNPKTVSHTTLNRLGPIVAECLHKASACGFLLFDVKPCNLLLVSGTVSGNNNRCYARCIDFDPRFVYYVHNEVEFSQMAVLDKKERLDVVYVINAILLSLILQTQTRFSTAACLTQLRRTLILNIQTRMMTLSSSGDELLQVLSRVTFGDTNQQSNEGHLLNRLDSSHYMLDTPYTRDVTKKWHHVRSTFVLIVRQYFLIPHPAIFRDAVENDSLIQILTDYLYSSQSN